jgi:hypothetical protein
VNEKTRMALLEGRRRNPQIFPPMNGGENIRTNRNPASGASLLRQEGKA